MLMISKETIPELAAQFEARRAEELLELAYSQFGEDIALACSFGAEDVVLADMAAAIRPGARLFYLDTDFLFAETYALRDRIAARYPLKLEVARAALTPAEQAARFGEALWASDPDRCCDLRKVQPLRQQLATLAAWITGIRRDQAPTRANAGLVEWDKLFNLVKLNPLAKWTWQDVWAYIRANDVPYNVLHDRNYPSIGCWPCTREVKPGEDPRAGRWANFAKKECGLHTESEAAPAQ